MSAPRAAAGHRLRAARAEDWPALSALLSDSGLPAEDLDPAALERFEVAVDTRGRVVGVAGFERCDRDALLRSVAVAADWRGRGLGELLVAGREAVAKVAGVRSFYLLTTTAADYFRRLGYADIGRAEVPAAVAAHAQFRRLCPATARCLAKRL